MVLPASAAATLMTVEEFVNLALPDRKAELVRGELRVSPPAGGPHGVAATNLVSLLAAHAKATGVGRAFADGVGYELTQLPHTVRVPDVSFVRGDRLPAGGVGPGLLKLAPDLAVEVLSPSETASALEEKLHDYTLAGTPLIWIIDPIRRTVMVVARNMPVRWLVERDTLEAGDVIHGFACGVSEIFDGIAVDSST